MAEIRATLVKDLREKTGAGMMDCKKALVENGGDIDRSIDWLRTQGLAAAAKRSSRVASEGLVGVSTLGRKGSLVEINTETDFVARNVKFQEFVETVTNISLKGNGSIEELNSATYIGTDKTVSETLTNMVATVGEHMDLRRTTVLEVDNGVVCSYMHNSLRAGLGKIGVLVGLESNGNRKQLESFGKKLAMHIAASNPQVLSQRDVDTVDLEREKSILTEQARESGKPEEIIKKMVDGRLHKYFEEVCLLEQTYVIDTDSKVSKAVEAATKEIDAPIEISGFARFALGDGVLKKEEDFAEEVAAVASS